MDALTRQAQCTAAADGWSSADYAHATAALANALPMFYQLSLLEQLAVLADFLPMLADQQTPKQLADSYARNIGSNLKSYAACMIINLQRACEVSRQCRSQPAGAWSAHANNAYVYTTYAEAKAVAERIGAAVMRADIGVISERAANALFERR